MKVKPENRQAIMAAIDADIANGMTVEAACERQNVPPPTVAYWRHLARIIPHAVKLTSLTDRKKVDLIATIKQDMLLGSSLITACEKRGVTIKAYQRVCSILGLPSAPNEVVTDPIKTRLKSRKQANPDAWAQPIHLVAVLGHVLHFAVADLAYGVASGMINKQLDPASLCLGKRARSASQSTPYPCDVLEALEFLTGEGGLLYCNLINTILGTDRIHPDWLVRRALRDALDPHWLENDRMARTLRRESLHVAQAEHAFAHRHGQTHERPIYLGRRSVATRLAAASR